MRLPPDANYATLNRIGDELEYAMKIMERIGCPVIDVSHKAIEETANTIMEIVFKNNR
jgi:regulator of PEP synthase PpsR (kinase-PPPase family)